ncbi:Oligopeptide transport system permease OppC [Klebsiella pneumoniae]|uniref:Oligopeptide transport system permease OppC n=1 Tax=Klebsiella pneumoniae TaxID=573 RepID=A0A2X3GUX7_KLEPN|nr:Oligopeptide transport system permease OppC [Klebsiella pneumoniae]
MSFFSPVNQARWARFRHNRRGYWSLWLFFNSLSLQPGAPSCWPTIARCWCSTGAAVRPGVKKTTPSKPSAARSPPPPTIRIPGCSSSWRLTAGRYGRQCASARRQLILPARFPFHRRPRPATGLGTDANGGDVLARILYGTRISVLFGLLLTLFSSVLGVLAGAIQGYYGGKIDCGDSALSKSGPACQRCS